MGEGTTRSEYSYNPAQQCFNEKHTTEFVHLLTPQLKGMATAANPTEVAKVANGWSGLYTKLVGGKPSDTEAAGGGILKDFSSAVDKVLEDWEGDAADKFKAEAKKIKKKISDASQYAKYTHVAMDSVARVLADIRPKVMNAEPPSSGESMGDKIKDLGSRDDSGFRNDIAAGMPTQQALDKHRGDLSKGKEFHVELAIEMERLGSLYNSQAKALGSWERRNVVTDGENYPGDPGGIVPVAAVVPPNSSGGNPTGLDAGKAGQQGSAFDPNGINSPRADGISGGVGATGAGTGGPTAQVGTGLNSAGTGTGISGGGTNLGGLGAGSTGGVPTSSGPGASGVGALPPGGITGGSGRGGTGAGRGRMGGVPGMGGANAGAGGAKKGATGKGGIAKQKGGVVGATGKGAARAQGGAGLHRSRGGSQKGKVAGRGAGMVGAPGARGKADEKNREGARPDYLVEDEETWVPKKNVTPRVVD